MSGLEKGIKWLSNINMGLSVFLIAFFVFSAPPSLRYKPSFMPSGTILIALPAMSTTVWQAAGTETSVALEGWQASWTIFYWAWWIAFAPFVGYF